LTLNRKAQKALQENEYKNNFFARNVKRRERLRKITFSGFSKKY